MDESTAHLETPVARIVAETDRRVLVQDAGVPGPTGSGIKPSDVTVQTQTRELRIGVMKDSAPITRFASFGKGQPVLVVSGNGLSSDLFDPVQYISKRAAQTPIPDIGMLVFERSMPDVPATPVQPHPKRPVLPSRSYLTSLSGASTGATWTSGEKPPVPAKQPSTTTARRRSRTC